MAWIESHQTLREHPKVYVLVDALGVSKAQVLGHLHLLWWWCVDYAPDGVISQNDVAIARAAEWSGDPKQYVTALVTAGFVDRRGDVLVMHDWGEYRLHYDLLRERQERQREQTRERVRLFREKKRASNAAVTPSNSPTVPNSTQTNITKPGLKRSLLKVIAVDPGGCGGEGNDSEQNLKIQDLLDRVVEFTNSPGSRAFYQKAIRVLGPGLVEEAVGEVRMRAPESRARYLSALLSEWMDEKTNAPA